MEANKHTNTYLSFIIDNDYFAVNVYKVLEVLQKQKIVRIPNAPFFIKGVINFRGDIIPVIETRTKFNLPAREEDAKFVIIVLEIVTDGETTVIGAVVDRVKDVLSIAEKEIKPIPKMKSNYSPEYFRGLAQVGEEFIMLLEVDKVFSGDEIEILNSTISEEIEEEAEKQHGTD